MHGIGILSLDWLTVIFAHSTIVANNGDFLNLSSNFTENFNVIALYWLDLFELIFADLAIFKNA